MIRTQMTKTILTAFLAVGDVRNVGEWYKSSTNDVSKTRIRFLTATIGHVRYKFEGEFMERATLLASGREKAS